VTKRIQKNSSQQKQEVSPMSIISRFSMTLTIAAVAACGLPMTQAESWAADCPAGKTAVDAMRPGPMAPSDVTDTVISSIDLKPIGPGFDGRKMRLRKLIVQPGGIVPWHSHDSRPANIYIISGSITEYRSTCAVPIEHEAGDVTSEFGPLAHWRKNNTKKPTVLLSADILPPDIKPDESM
jgi:quercetin dioxygenase-like cupin family protein